MRFMPNEPNPNARQTIVRLVKADDGQPATGKGFGLGAAPAGCFVRKDIAGGGAEAAALGRLIELGANMPGVYAYEYTQAELAASRNSSVILRLSGLVNTNEFEQTDEIDPGPNVAVCGIATGGSATTVTLGANASGVDNYYRGRTVRLDGGTGGGQWGFVTGYVGNTTVATVRRAFATAPVAGTTWSMTDDGSDLADGAIVATTFATNAVDANAIADGAITGPTFAAGAIDTTAVNANVVAAIQAGLATAAGTHADAVSISNLVTALPTASQVAAAVLSAVVTGTISVQVALQALLAGGSMSNTYTDQMTYDPTTKVLLSWRTRLFANAADANTAAGGGSASAVVTLAGTNTQTSDGKVATSVKVLS